MPLFGSSSEDKMKQQKIIFVPTIFVFRMQSLHYFKYIMAGAAGSGAMQTMSVNDMFLSVRGGGDANIFNFTPMMLCCKRSC